MGKRLSKEQKRSMDIITKIGTCSINKIIKDRSLQDLHSKIDYIRHQYTYYDGNYSLFHDKDGFANKHKYFLNSLIKKVISGKVNASVLRIYNRRLLKIIRKRKCSL